MTASRSAAAFRCFSARASTFCFSRLCCTCTKVLPCALLSISRISACRTTQSVSFALASTPMLRGLMLRGLIPRGLIIRGSIVDMPNAAGRALIGRGGAVRPARGERPAPRGLGAL